MKLQKDNERLWELQDGRDLSCVQALGDLGRRDAKSFSNVLQRFFPGLIDRIGLLDSAKGPTARVEHVGRVRIVQAVGTLETIDVVSESLRRHDIFLVIRNYYCDLRS